MWPSRFTQSSSHLPNPSSRPSAAPSRRPSNLGPYGGAPNKAAFSPRSSSLNVSSKANASATSLNSPYAIPSSSLKQEVQLAPDFREPLEVLEGILGRSTEDVGLRDLRFPTDRPEELVKDVNFQNNSLKDFALQDTPSTSKSHRAPLAEEYENDRAQFEDLHESITSCDEVLRSVETSLARFQKDLGTVSAEIESLQDRSIALNTRLDNRRVVERRLGPPIEDITISPKIVKKISRGPIDFEWVGAIGLLEKGANAVESRLKASEKLQAVTDIKPLLDDLIILATERIRDYFVAQIKSLRSPSINAQIIQHQRFLSYKDLFAFLWKHEPQIAAQIGQAYSNTMRWYYQSNFTKYMQALEKIPLFVVDKHEALGVEQTTSKNASASSSAAQKSQAALTLGRRHDILTKSDYRALPSHLATETRNSAYMETPFHAFSTAISDNASAEYSFLSSFFPPTAMASSVPKIFSHIFNPIFDMSYNLTKHLIENSYDCLGILLCIRINQHHAFSLQRRKCPVADGWTNGTNMLLWPRFQQGMDNHVDSVKRATTTASSSYGSKATLSLTSSSRGDDGKGAASTAPHPITQRFGQFLQGMLVLNSSDPSTATGTAAPRNAMEGEPVGRSVIRLRTEMDAFLTKVSRSVSNNQSRKDRFLANNYSLILTIIGDASGQMANEQRDWFEQRRESVAANAPT